VKYERAREITWDVICLVLGAGGIAIQIITGEVHEALLVTCTTLLGVPGVIAGVGLIRSSANGQRVPTDVSSSPSQQPVAPSEPSSQPPPT
jgi:hypothetical protein